MAKCVPNELDTSPLAPCATCLGVRRDSKKIIHDVPCIRFKVTSMAVYRPGGLDYTKRFDHTKVVDVTDYSDNAIYDIEITQDLCSHPMRLRVRRFNPKDTDVTYRRYMDNGTAKRQDTGAFCLASVEETASGFSQYIDCNALEGLERAAKFSDGIVREVFKMIASHCRSLSVRPDTPFQDVFPVTKALDRIPSKPKIVKAPRKPKEIRVRRISYRSWSVFGSPYVSE